MEKKELKASFKEFIKNFPQVEMPIILGEEAHHTFSSENKPIPQRMIETFIIPLEKDELDEFTEFIACLQFPPQEAYRAIVYWKAGLLNYQYVLASFDKEEKLIDRRVIAGTYYDGDQLTQSVATLKADGQIIIASGRNDPSQETFQAATSTAYRLQLSTKGKIVNL